MAQWLREDGLVVDECSTVEQAVATTAIIDLPVVHSGSREQPIMAQNKEPI